MSTRLASALRTAPSRSIGSGVVAGRSVGSMRRVPQVVVGAADDQALQRQLVGAARRFRVDQRLPAGRLFGLRLDDVDRRHGADLDLGPVVLHQLRGEIEIAACRFDVVDPEHQIPVGIADLGFGDRQRRAQVEIGDLRLQRLDQQARPGRIDLEVPQQRLRVLRLDVRRVRRIPRGCGVCDVSSRVLLKLAASAPPPQRKFFCMPAFHCIVSLVIWLPPSRPAAGWSGRLVGALREEARRQARPVGRPQRRDLKVEQLRLEPLHLDVQVALERAAHRVVGRQRDVAGPRSRDALIAAGGGAV